VEAMKDGDIAGLAVFQDPYAYIAVKREKGGMNLIMVNNGELVASVPLRSTIIYLRSILSNSTEKANFAYSYDNRVFQRLGNELKMRFSLKVFTGNKFGLFNYATQESGGYVDFDWFTMN
jgi:beta-xylosidase